MNATEYLRMKLPKGSSVYVEDGWLRIVVAEPEQPAPEPSSIDADENHRTEDGVRYRAEEAAYCPRCSFFNPESGRCDVTGRAHCFPWNRRDRRSIIWVRE